MDVERKMNRGEMAVKIEKQQGKIAELQAENKRLAKENKRLKEALEIAYEAYKDKCTGKKYTVKQIGRVHRFCKQALKGISDD